MNPFTRDRSILIPSIVRDHIDIDPTSTREAQFDKWLNSLPTRNCKRHCGTRLALARKASERESLSRNVEEIWDEHWYLRDTPVPKTHEDCYPFVALFRCPACKLEYARVPPEFYESSFEGFLTDTEERATNLAKCREFAAQVNQRHRGFLLMSGFSGNGKTRLSCNVIRGIHYADALYVRQGELTIALRATYGRKDVFLHRPPRRGDEETDDEPPTLLEIVQQVGFFVLDEVGCNALANDERLLLDELFKHRYEHRKPTILISNLTLAGTPEKAGLKQFLGDALTERIAHATGNGRFILQFSGESYRRTSRETYLEGLG